MSSSPDLSSIKMSWRANNSAAVGTVGEEEDDPRRRQRRIQNTIQYIINLQWIWILYDWLKNICKRPKKAVLKDRGLESTSIFT